jgi:hypothetical protein
MFSFPLKQKISIVKYNFVQKKNLMIRINKIRSYALPFLTFLSWMMASLTTFGQHQVNPGRPSFSENNHIVPKLSIQGENGFSMTENKQELVYAFNTLLRMGLSDKWETRVFSGIETTAVEGEKGYSELQTGGVGLGLKYLALEAKNGKPSVGLLAQSYVPTAGAPVNSLGFLATKEFDKVSAEININPTFKGNSFSELAYIVCVGYGLGKVSVFAEGMLNDHVGPTREVWVQGGASYLVNPLWQIDFSAASYGPQLSNQMFQLGFSFLMLSKAQKAPQLLKDRS